MWWYRFMALSLMPLEFVFLEFLTQSYFWSKRLCRYQKKCLTNSIIDTLTICKTLSKCLVQSSTICNRIHTLLSIQRVNHFRNKFSKKKKISFPHNYTITKAILHFYYTHVFFRLLIGTVIKYFAFILEWLGKKTSKKNISETKLNAKQTFFPKHTLNSSLQHIDDI